MEKKYILIIIAVVIVFAITVFVINFYNKKSYKEVSEVSSKNKLEEKAEVKMKLKSVFEDGEFIPKKYTCDGEDISPPLEITEIPENTKSLVLIMDDPDAPVGTWVHWVLWNIPPETTKIEEKSIPAGAVRGINDFKKLDYGGPCPPSGTHRYFFKLYALDTTLDLPEGSTKEEVEQEMEGHILEKVELIGKYSRT